MMIVLYPWLKALHIISMVAWMAALFYLPRLYSYHVSSGGRESNSHDIFSVMERRLLQIIATPAMLLTWIFGLLLLWVPGIIDWQAFWPWLKLVAILAMTWFQFWLAARRRELLNGDCRLSAKMFRRMNEVPTVLLIVIVIMVIVRPF